MPELPEVETVVRGLRQDVMGKKFWKFESFNERTFLPGVADFLKLLPGRRIEDIWRKGKYIVLVLSGGMRMVVHLRMTGMLTWEKVVKAKKFIRGIFTFSDGSRLFFTDLRKFGKIYLYSELDFLEKTGMIKLGVDPISEPFTVVAVERVYRGKKGILKAKLLDQSLVAGIGNIYADEICFRIGLHPGTRLEKLRRNDFERLYEAISHCLNEGIKHSGTTFSDFRGTRGDSGKHQKYLQVYGRLGDQCYSCSGEIKKTRLVGRGTFYCLNCQRFKK